MLKYKCLVLDHDDTIVQTERAIGFPYFQKYIERIRPGQTLTFEEYIRDCNNMVFSTMCKQRWNFTEEEAREEYTGWKAYCQENIPPLCPGIDKIILRQKEAGGLVCVSSLSTKDIIARDFLHHMAIMPDAIYDNDLSADLRKPNVYALNCIMEQFNLQPNDILVVDDMKLGLQMAHQANIDFAYAGWSRPEFPELAAQMQQISDYSFFSTEELEQFLFG